ncbi:YqcI/YcgG family protein [Cytobacillus spongiae]|uniref:YqcI/YcgG family protein n=1 Tax=Cytobacillus spongiae TaxID=2901381 RepID=UPI001F48D5EB|nr:YqcI/YcgG family protein [Cytobacillus spongiae]UII54247.1 YqcI/YcgG family protein [Cytobacillus spongiae]
MSLLFDKKQIEGNPSVLTDWEKFAFQAFSEKLSNKQQPFPCIPATVGFSQNHLKYGFVSELESETAVDELADLLKEFGLEMRDIGNYASLIVFFQGIEQQSVIDYEKRFWSLLTKVSEKDENEWPNHIPENPENNAWEYCFNGEQYFMYCATPSHENRKSRTFPYFMLAITPRWVLEKFNENSSSAKRMKKMIRQRLEAYDSIEAHPELKWYGQEDNFEWKQYFLRDDDSSLSKCPFTRMKNALNKLRP